MGPPTRHLDVAMKRICDHLVSCQMSFSSPLFTTIHVFFFFSPTLLFAARQCFMALYSKYISNQLAYWLIVIVNNIYFILSISFYPFSRPTSMICQHSFPFFRPLGPSSQLEMVLTISCWLPDQVEFRPAYFWVVSPPCLVLQASFF